MTEIINNEPHEHIKSEISESDLHEARSFVKRAKDIGLTLLVAVTFAGLTALITLEFNRATNDGVTKEWRRGMEEKVGRLAVIIESRDSKSETSLQVLADHGTEIQQIRSELADVRSASSDVRQLLSEHILRSTSESFSVADFNREKEIIRLSAEKCTAEIGAKVLIIEKAISDIEKKLAGISP